MDLALRYQDQETAWKASCASWCAGDAAAHASTMGPCRRTSAAKALVALGQEGVEQLRIGQAAHRAAARPAQVLQDAVGWLSA